MLSTPRATQPCRPRWQQHTAPERQAPNPWVSDQVLLNLSLWWVQSTYETGEGLPGEVGRVFRSLQQQLQYTARPTR